MGLRFYRRIRLGSGLSLNLSKSGLSLTAGTRGFHVTAGTHGINTSGGAARQRAVVAKQRNDP
jgi:Protein of unknown function (DUF4236)